MSDTATETVEAATGEEIVTDPPVTAEPEPTVEEQEPEPKKGPPVTKHEARVKVQEDSAKAREKLAAAQKAADEANAEKSASEGTDEGTGEGTDEEKSAGEETTGDKHTEEGAEGAKEGESTEAKSDVTPIQIPIDANHPVREMGEEALTASNAKQERVIRALLNSYTRRRDVAAVEEKLAKIEAKNVELQQKVVRRESTDTALEKFENTPEYEQAKTTFLQMKELEQNEELPKGAASEYWEGFKARLTPLAQAEYDQRMSAVQEQKGREAQEAWQGEAWENASQMPAGIPNIPNFRTLFDQAVQSFDAELELGHYPEIKTSDDMHKEFTKFFGSMIVRDPAVREAFRRHENRQKEDQAAATTKAAADDREREAIGRAAVEKHLKDAADKRREGPPHPLGNLHAASSDSLSAAPAGDDDLSKLTPHEAKKRAKSGARQDARRHFGQ